MIGARNPSGFTLIELVIIIVLLGIISSVVIIKMGGLIRSSEVNATMKEMKNLKQALVGNPNAVVEGRYVNPGYKGDVGSLPGQANGLGCLVENLDSAPAWNKFTRRGWNGPYIEAGTDDDYKKDAWGNDYIYNKSAATITSKGPDGIAGNGDDIVIKLLE